MMDVLFTLFYLPHRYHFCAIMKLD